MLGKKGLEGESFAVCFCHGSHGIQEKLQKLVTDLGSVQEEEVEI